MTTLSDRRSFLLAAALSPPAWIGLSGAAKAIEPIPRSGPAKFRLSLAGYSFRQKLELKKKPKPDWTYFDFIDFAAKQPLAAVELTGYYFAETTPEYLAKLKLHAAKAGLDISGTAVGNDFCVADPEKLKAEVASVKSWIEHTARIGGKTMRIFAGKTAKGETEETALKRCIPAIEECCDHAAKFGVLLALENHGGITATAAQLLNIVRSVKHEAFGVNLDTGNFRTEDPYADLAKLAPYAVTVQLKTEIFPAGKKAEEADLKRLIGILTEAKYRGYVALEYEAAEDAMTAVPKYLSELAKLIG